LRKWKDRRHAILFQHLPKQGKLTAEAGRDIRRCRDQDPVVKHLLPAYKTKRRLQGPDRTIERRLEPLADQLFDESDADPEQTASGYVSMPRKALRYERGP